MEAFMSVLRVAAMPATPGTRDGVVDIRPRGDLGCGTLAAPAAPPSLIHREMPVGGGAGRGLAIGPRYAPSPQSTPRDGARDGSSERMAIGVGGLGDLR